MSLNVKQHVRSVYSILDFLGDVGGLFSILLSIGSLVVSAYSMISSPLEDFLSSKVFQSSEVNGTYRSDKIDIKKAKVG